MSRRTVLILFTAIFVPLIFVLYIASPLLLLLFENGLKDSVSLATVEANGNRSAVLHPIPKIIHQTWKSEIVPEHWQIAQFTWYDGELLLDLTFEQSRFAPRLLLHGKSQHYFGIVFGLIYP